MPRRSKTSRARSRPPLNRDRILEAAVALADGRGVASLSMRELASEMGCGAMSLYNHVAHKDDLLEGMIERVAGEFTIPEAPTEDWRADVRRLARSAQRTLMRHPWAAPRWSDHEPGPIRLRYLDAILRLLREAGCSVHDACTAFHAITTHVVGFTLQRIDFPIAYGDLQSVASDFLGRMPREEFPWFAEHVRHHVETPKMEDGFDFVLDLILDEVERGLDRAEAPPS
ncbi:MAG: TetR/AcrR family transcriptional regulator [Myxococcota bacterium]